MSFRRVLLNTCQEEFEGAAAAREVCTWQTAPTHVNALSKIMLCAACYVCLCYVCLHTGRQCVQSRTAAP